jgi:hypothetical protein
VVALAYRRPGGKARNQQASGERPTTAAGTGGGVP